MSSSTITETVLIIGGGIVGLATAYQLLKILPDLQVTILEKEDACGQHQSTHNSGVLHCGLYYKPGSVKARLAVHGIRQMVTFCRENGIAHEICGKLVVAKNVAEVERLNTLFARGTQNGLRGLKLLSAGEIHELEPHAAGMAAIHVPEEGIVDYAAVVRSLASAIKSKGGRIVTGARTTGLRRVGAGWLAITSLGEFKGGFLLNAAGLHSDRVCKLAGEKPESRIIPFRGEYFKVRTGRENLVRGLIYPVPDPQFPFLGVHFTRLIGGGVEAGPNAVLAMSREGYKKTDFNFTDALDSLTYPGLLRFISRYHRMCAAETMRSYSKKLFCRALQTLVPEITLDDLETGGAGVRAQAMTRNGVLVEDFQLVQNQNSLHVLNAPSPAATASLAIGEHIASVVAGMFGHPQVSSGPLSIQV